MLDEEGVGSAFSPLAQGLLTDRYLGGIAADSRAGKANTALREQDVTPEKVEKVRRLNEIAQGRGQTLAQMALAWVLRGGRVTSALIGASRVSQVEDNVAALANLAFIPEERSKLTRLWVSRRREAARGNSLGPLCSHLFIFCSVESRR